VETSNEQLAAAAHDGNRRALFDLWEAVKPFCMAAALHTYHRHDPDKLAARGVTIEDLQQETYFAFTEAVKGFDSSTGYKFLTYMTFPLRNVFARALGYKTAKTDPLDSSMSLDAPAGGEAEDPTPLSDAIPDPDAEQRIEDAENRHFYAQLHAALEVAMQETCDDVQRDVLRSRFYDEMTRPACGEALGLSPAEVRKHEAAGLRNLRSPEASERLQHFVTLDILAYGFSTSFHAWKDGRGSVPERVVEDLNK